MHPLPFGERYGKKSWVVITGSSDGIGLEFANQFASRGFNIVMIARNQERLE
jgi:short-subunit dehydrogenase